MTDWQEVKLGDVCLFIDYRGKTPHKTTSGIPLITAKIVKNGRINEATEFISHEEYKARMTRGLPNIGDILITTEAPMGEVAELKNDKVAIGQRIITLRPQKNILNNRYLKYFLQSNIGQNQLRARESGTTVTGIKSAELKQISIYLPPLEVQKKIAGVLGALDDKIELNNKINQNLEAQAQALFKSWFVDFEPFGGKMPDDWKIKTIGDVCASISETYNRKDENVVLINTSDILNGEILTHSLVKNENLKGQFKKTFQKNDILYSEIRPINKRFAFVDIENTYNYIASTKLMVIRPDTSKISPLILYRILKSQDLIDELQHLAETRSGTFPQITFASELAIQKIVLAPLNEQKIISNVLEVLENKIRKNIQENLRLAELRDTLLPKLMSGEINVDDVKID